MQNNDQQISNIQQGMKKRVASPLSMRVTNVNVQGEVLSTPLVTIPFDRIGTQAEATNISNSGAGVSAANLHSRALLTAFMQSGDQPTTTASEHTLGQVTFKLPDLLKMIFDDKLFASDPLNKDNPKENLLERLVEHEAGAGTALPADQMVTRFTKDLWKLAQDGGLTLTDQNPGNPDVHDLSDALIAFAMQFYYQNTPNAINRTKELFSTDGLGGGIRFDRNDVADTLAAARGYDLYFKHYLDRTNNFSLEEQTLIKSILPALRDWFVQSGTGGMTAADTQNRGDFMLGGSVDDNLYDNSLERIAA